MRLRENKSLSGATPTAGEIFLGPPQGWPSDPRVGRVLRMFQNHLDRPLRIHEVAKSVLLSRSRFGYLFRRDTASSPARVLKTLRLIEARRILGNSDLSVKEVAARVGINDLSHFVRDFQTAFGLSPARYKKQIQVTTDKPNGPLKTDPCNDYQATKLAPNHLKRGDAYDGE